MKRVLFFTAILIATAALFACNKEDKTEIPTSLTNSKWLSTINPDNFEQTVVEFIDSQNAIFSVIKRGYGTNQTIVRREYSYTYNYPDITLKPKCLIDPLIKGEMLKLYGSHDYMHLKSNVGDLDIHLSQNVDKDQTIWQ